MKENADNLTQVAEFMRAFEQPVGTGWLDSDGIRLGLKLIKEEETELEEAATILEAAPYVEAHHLNFVKELTDLLYVAYWLAARVGIDIDRAFRLVHQSNMTKLGKDGRPVTRADGKVLKGPDYRKPDLVAVANAVPVSL